MSHEMFYPLTSREYYRTKGFAELALQLSSDLSYRQATTFLNRVRWQIQGGTPMRTLTSIVEREGSTMQKTLVDLTEHIFAEHQFDRDGLPQTEESTFVLAPAEAGLSPQVINNAVSEYNLNKEEGFQIDTSATHQLYEDPHNLLFFVDGARSQPDTIAERMTAAKEAAKERSEVQKQNGYPEKDRKQSMEREER